MRQAAQTVSLDDVDREHAAPSLSLAFSDPIEGIYREESARHQRGPLVVNSLIGCALFDGFIVTDYLLTKEAFIWYFVGRFLIVTPFCLTTIYILWRNAKHKQIVTCANILIMTVTLSILVGASEGAYRSYYFFGIILMMVGGYVVGRLRIPYAIATVILQEACYQITGSFSDVVSRETSIVSTLFGLSGVVVTIMAAYAIQGIDRRAFLLSLRVRLLNRELEPMAMTDPLTGLGNRRSLDEATTGYWRDAATDTGIASLILIDIDHFKRFNDGYGHSAGDACLAAIAQRIVGALRDGNDRAVRFGGEEIVVFLPDTPFTEARIVAEAIRTAILAAAIPHPVLGPGAVVTASLGVATAPKVACTPAELVARADTALYAAKNNGRNQVWPPIGRGVCEPAQHGPSDTTPALAEAG